MASKHTTVRQRKWKEIGASNARYRAPKLKYSDERLVEGMVNGRRRDHTPRNSS
jgi:hypothetical protein